MKTLDLVTFILVVVGALNWLLVGLFRFDLVATVVGLRFGELAPFSSLVYILVGLAAVVQVFMRASRHTAYHERPTRLYPR